MARLIPADATSSNQPSSNIFLFFYFFTRSNVTEHIPAMFTRGNMAKVISAIFTSINSTKIIRYLY
jgi:hypothetical protein